MTRRDFITLCSLVPSALIMPLFSIEKRNKTVVLIELAGGNDGLNTIVPYRSRPYYTLRPTLAIEQSQLNILDRELGLHPSLVNMADLYEKNHVAIINGLGYEKPNFSHFKSIQLVETAMQMNRGWMDNTLIQHSLNHLYPIHGLIIGKRKKGHLFSKQLNVLQIKDTKSFISQTKNTSFDTSISSHSYLAYFEKQKEIIRHARKQFQLHIKTHGGITSHRNNDSLMTNFQEAFNIIHSGMDIPVIKISHKGYDTHSNQSDTHSNLLKELDQALGDFVRILKKYNLFENVLIMTYSEFGRRVNENGSFGTDHGTASSQFIIGGQVKGGLYGDYPRLDHLENNNLVYTTDYRTVYNTILNKWFYDSNNVFSHFPVLKFL